MRRFLLALGLLIAVSSFYNTAEAQHVNVNINIGRQPAWGPIGYDYVNYYYFPDINVYYDVNQSFFIYSDRGRWITARYLPYAYRSYDLYGLYKVVLDARDPWLYNRVHYRDYARYRGVRHQRIIRDSRSAAYRDSRRNYVTWYSGDRHNNHRNNYRSYDTPRYSNDRPASSSSSRPSYNDNRRSSDNNRNYNNRSNDSYNRNDRNDRNDRNSNAGRSRTDKRDSSSRSNNKDTRYAQVSNARSR